MKIKLESPDLANPWVTTLVVTEKIELTHVAVLKAGLTKLIHSGKKSLLLDLSAVKNEDVSSPSIFKEISDLKSWATDLNAQVLVISAVPGLGHAATRAEAVQQLSGTGATSRLNDELFKAMAKKATLEKKLSQLNAAEDVKKLLKTKSDLERSIAEAERMTARFLKNRSGEPHALPAFQLAKEALEEVLVGVLKKESVLS